MTVQNRITVQHGTEIIVPLSKLKKSPRNARKTEHSPADIETLAASIAVKGILQPPVVEPELAANGQPTGCYLVTIGEGRRLALRLLAKWKQLAKDADIRCLLDTDNDAFEVSLDENVTRFAMHPADQFEAFKQLAEDRGLSAEDIATRFGVSAHLVRQRLRLGGASPRLMALYRAGDLSLEQLMAFAVCEDHARQEQVFENLSYNRSATFIRRAMTEHEVEAKDRRAVFVGAESYEAAGGTIRRDLFSEDYGGWFEDVALLDRLVADKLHGVAEGVRAEEGWSWAEAHLDYPHAHGLSREYPRYREPDAETQAALDALSEEYDAIVEGCDEGEPIPPEQEARLKEIDQLLESATLAEFDPEVRAKGGVFVTLSHDGHARIERGFVRAEEQASAIEQENGERAGEETPPSPEANTVDEPTLRPLPDRLVRDLTAHRTAALRDRLAQNPHMAFLAALHSFVLPLFYRGPRESTLEINCHSTDLATSAKAYLESVAGIALEARHASWAARLPENPRLLWDAILAMKGEDRTNLFAHCISRTLNAVSDTEPRYRTHADALAEHLSLDMHAYWKPTPDTYFNHLTKAHILAAVREGVSEKAAGEMEGMKKEVMAERAADLLGSRGWLPPLVKGAAVPPT